MRARELEKRLSCLLLLLTLALSTGYTVRIWFTYLEPRWVAAVHSPGYRRATFKVTGLSFTPAEITSDVAVSRAQGTVEEHTQEWLEVDEILPRTVSTQHELERALPVGTSIEVLFNPDMEKSKATLSSPRVVPYQDNFVTRSRLVALRGLVVTFWPPLLWVVLFYLWVRYETSHWKARARVPGAAGPPPPAPQAKLDREKVLQELLEAQVQEEEAEPDDDPEEVEESGWR